MRNTTMETAHQAFQHFKQGLATGEWEPFLDMLTDDHTFRIFTFLDEFRGKNLGKEQFAALLHRESNDWKLRVSGTLDGVTSNETTVGFECRVEGSVMGERYKNQLAIFFDVRGDKISGFREYAGGVDPKSVSKAAEAS